ncbi:MAG TPA: hypothetical protein PLW35_05080 [Verrucomicrobiota bacterium]|nr:hypothetical protein [Verrucomicrobiota bacterium]
MRPVSIPQIRPPNIHRPSAAKNRRAPARAGKRNGAGSAAVLGRISPTTDRAPVSITQTRRPNIDRLGAGKNARAPARAGKGNGAGSAAVLGRINVTTDPTTSLDHANPAPEHSPVGDAQTTCLSPYRHPRGTSADFGNRGSAQGTICSACRNPGARPK